MDHKKLLKVLKNSKQVYREDYVKKIFRSAHYDVGLFEEQLNEFNSTLSGSDSEKAKSYMDRTILAQVIDDASILLEIVKDSPCLSTDENKAIEEMIYTLDEMSNKIEVLEEVKALADMTEQEGFVPTSQRKDRIYANV
ncbi:hypothetical protein RE474_09520 [Methanolobus sediminis]|uniref:Uncharacterized protein n=1 Tax=Methanolobus sediminis TaxID=3072978 RepID=A0AA51UJ27_9EURY|nr:hypothetical protein [Methanolobus sediminis]WMW24330.1 hypothetical protein RE474_09520 [Methanolobus sediminis]